MYITVSRIQRGPCLFVKQRSAEVSSSRREGLAPESATMALSLEKRTDTYGGTSESDTRGEARRGETRRETSLHWNVSDKGVSLWNVKPSRRRYANEHRFLYLSVILRDSSLVGNKARRLKRRPMESSLY